MNLSHTFDVYSFDDAWSRLTELGFTEATAFIMLGRSIAEGWDENAHPSVTMETVRVEFDMDARENKYFAITEGLLWTHTSQTSGSSGTTSPRTSSASSAGASPRGWS